MLHGQFHLSTRSRVGAVALAAGVIVVGGVLVVVGLTALLGLLTLGVIAGTGLAVYRRVRGGGSSIPRPPLTRTKGLDPTLEVFPPEDGR